MHGYQLSCSDNTPSSLASLSLPFSCQTSLLRPSSCPPSAPSSVFWPPFPAACRRLVGGNEQPSGMQPHPPKVKIPPDFTQPTAVRVYVLRCSFGLLARDLANRLVVLTVACRGLDLFLRFPFAWSLAVISQRWQLRACDPAAPQPHRSMQKTANALASAPPPPAPPAPPRLVRVGWVCCSREQWHTRTSSIALLCLLPSSCRFT